MMREHDKAITRRSTPPYLRLPTSSLPRERRGCARGRIHAMLTTSANDINAQVGLLFILNPELTGPTFHADA